MISAMRYEIEVSFDAAHTHERFEILIVQIFITKNSI